MTTFRFVEGSLARFDGDFALESVSPHISNPEEKGYLETLARVMDSLASDVENDRRKDSATGANVSTPKSLAREKSRTAIAKELKADATDFIGGNLSPLVAARNALVIKGKYRRDCERVEQLLFVVDVRPNDPGQNSTELYIEISPDRAGDGPSAEQNALYASLQSAENVVKAVCQRMRDGNAGKREEKRADVLQDAFIRKLAGIGRVGLQGPDVQLANLALNGLRTEFVMHEAGRVKNTYLTRLGVVAAIAATIFLLGYAAIDLGVVALRFWTIHKTFLLAAAGAAIGTWLSFSIRRVSLSFEDLGVLEEDLLDPALRVVFVVAMTITACLLFWNSAINIEIGALKTAGLIGSKALLVGIFCGIAERALATAISGRAATFMKSIGGS